MKGHSIFSNYHLIDLTHGLNESVPTWSGGCGFQQQLAMDYAELCRVFKLKFAGGVGTHIDAPNHFIAGAMDIANIPLEKLLVPAHVIDVSEDAGADYLISPADITKYENTYGLISEDSLVIFHTGWSHYWSQAEKYRNVDVNGVMRFPSVAADTAHLLLERNIAGIAIDTLSPDCPNTSFPVHRNILGAGKYIIENIANTEQLTPRGALVISLPTKLQEGTEAPLRTIALIPR